MFIIPLEDTLMFGKTTQPIIKDTWDRTFSTPQVVTRCGFLAERKMACGCKAVKKLNWNREDMS